LPDDPCSSERFAGGNLHHRQLACSIKGMAIFSMKVLREAQQGIGISRADGIEMDVHVQGS
jgi:hypothetical protein